MSGTGTGGYMLDANAFDYLLDHAIDPRSVRRLGELCITTVQHGELLSVPDRRRRERLLRVLSEIDPTVRPAWPDARCRDDTPGDDPVRHDTPSRAAGRRRGPGSGSGSGSAREPAHRKDAAIAAAAELEGCVLVTDDKAFRRRALAAGLAAMSCAEAFAGLDTLPAAR